MGSNSVLYMSKEENPMYLQNSLLLDGCLKYSLLNLRTHHHDFGRIESIREPIAQLRRDILGTGYIQTYSIPSTLFFELGLSPCDNKGCLISPTRHDKIIETYSDHQATQDGVRPAGIGQEFRALP